jgi:hypothetical protein
MRIILVVFLNTILVVSGMAQEAMPVDERGIFTYQEVVQLNGYPATLLYNNARDFVKELSVRNDRTKHYRAWPDSLTVYNRGSYGMSNLYTIGKRTDGIVIFDMTVEVKEGRFRYTITNFMYREFERNRYGKFVPANKRDVPLEHPPAGLLKKQWENNLEKTDEKIQELIIDLKENMARSAQKKSRKKEKNDKSDW